MKLHIYYNGFIHNLVNVSAAAYGRSRTNRRSTADKVRIKAAGILVPGFDQTTPGEANRSSASNLTLTRLYMMDNSELRTFEVLRLFNEPYFSDLSRKFHFDWRDFYQPNANTSELVSVTEEPDLGTSSPVPIAVGEKERSGVISIERNYLFFMQSLFFNLP